MKTVIVVYNQTEEEFTYYLVETGFAKFVTDRQIIDAIRDRETITDLDYFSTKLFEHLPLTKEQFLQAAREGCDIIHIVYV
jgi:hypothetical protein